MRRARPRARCLKGWASRAAKIRRILESSLPGNTRVDRIISPRYDTTRNNYFFVESEFIRMEILIPLDAADDADRAREFSLFRNTRSGGHCTLVLGNKLLLHEETASPAL